VVAFGVSWFWKGFEWDMLRGHPAPEVNDGSGDGQEADTD
jgi:hypothetical protein